jgi:hypothetical protein
MESLSCSMVDSPVLEWNLLSNKVLHPVRLESMFYGLSLVTSAINHNRDIFHCYGTKTKEFFGYVLRYITLHVLLLYAAPYFTRKIKRSDSTFVSLIKYGFLPQFLLCRAQIE